MKVFLSSGRVPFLFFNKELEMKEENIIEELKRKVEEGGQEKEGCCWAP